MSAQQPGEPTDDDLDNIVDNMCSDPATVLMLRLKQDPRMDGVPMYVTYEDGSTLSVQSGPRYPER